MDISVPRPPTVHVVYGCSLKAINSLFVQPRIQENEMMIYADLLKPEHELVILTLTCCCVASLTCKRNEKR